MKNFILANGQAEVSPHKTCTYYGGPEVIGILYGTCSIQKETVR
jgi:hypothetical protein